jgi:hypothetical protein
LQSASSCAHDELQEYAASCCLARRKNRLQNRKRISGWEELLATGSKNTSDRCKQVVR